MVSHPELDSDPPIGSDRESGCDINWVEKSSFKKIQKLLEIYEREWHHKILLTTRNLSELSRSPSPYIILVIPRPLPIEMAKGEHYVIVDLLI